MNVAKLIELVEKVTLDCSRKIKLVLNPNGEYSFNFKEISKMGNTLNTDVDFDTGEWKIPQSKQQLVEELSKDSSISNEDKIICIFEQLAKEYTYDDNVLTYIRKNDDDKFELPEWYGKTTDEKWDEDREKHNKRVCYEVSRYLAKSLSEIFKKEKDFDVCVLWDENLTHYFVGLTTDEYSLTLDLDDFEKIKDLTRVKTNLTIEGIKILEDKNNKFRNAINSYNESKEKYAIKSIGRSIDELEKEKEEKPKQNEDICENEEVIYLKNALEVLKEEYDLDSAGIFEYMKEIVDIKLGSARREKVWKLIDEKNETYTRCIVFHVEDKKYIVDVDEKVLHEYEKDERFIPFKEMSRSW